MLTQATFDHGALQYDLLTSLRDFGMNFDFTHEPFVFVEASAPIKWLSTFTLYGFLKLIGLATPRLFEAIFLPRRITIQDII